MRLFFTYLFVTLGLLGLELEAQSSLSATIDRNSIGLNERFRYTITLDGTKGNIIPPDFTDFQIVGGPQTSSNMSWVNGQMTMNSSQTYFLSPNKSGTLTIGPARAKTNEGDLKSNSITIEVVKGNAPANTDPSARKGQVPEASASNEELFLRIYTDKRKVSQGEQIIVSYVLYNRYRGFEMLDYEMPKLTGFWKEEVKIDNIQWERQYERIGGKDYQKAYLVRQVLFPQRSGTLEIGPFSLEGRIGRSFFRQGQAVEITSNSVKIDVSPLPSGPSDFNGAVGSFDMDVKLDRTEVKTNEAINLTIKISGSGNLKLIDELPIEFPQDFEVYDPKVNDRISTNAGGVRGSRTFEYLIIPRYPGDYDIDPIEFSFYDPAQKKYRTRSSEPLSIYVERSGDEVGSSGNVTVRKEDVTVLDSDIRHIHLDTTDLSERGGMFAGSALHYTLVGTPLLLLFGLFFVLRRKREMESDVIGMRRKKAAKQADAHLKQAKRALDSGDRNAFYEDLYTGMNSYICHKFDLNASDMTKDSINEVLTGSGIDQHVIKRVQDLLLTCEMARFSPAGGGAESKAFEEAGSLIESMEEQA